METLRNLLQQGNTKLGEGIYTFSLPAVATCPGASPACRKECYALKGRFIFLRRAYRRYLAESQEQGFAARMIGEIRRRWAGCVRIHVSGDFLCGGPHKKSAVTRMRRYHSLSRGKTPRRTAKSPRSAPLSASSEAR